MEEVEKFEEEIERSKIYILSQTQNEYNLSYSLEEEIYILNALELENNPNLTIDDLSKIVSLRRLVYLTKPDPNLANLIAHNYITMSEMDSTKCQLYLKTALNFFEKILTYENSSQVYYDITVTKIKIINNDNETQVNKYCKKDEFIDALAYILLACEQQPENSSYSYYKGYIFEELYSMNYSENEFLQLYFWQNAKYAYEDVDVNNYYYELSLQGINRLEGCI